VAGAVMTASFLRASLFTSVVSFGVAALVAALGVLFILVGIAFLGILGKLDIRKADAAPDSDASATSAVSPPAAGVPANPSDEESAEPAST
jgi:predicted phage tail protein